MGAGLNLPETRYVRNGDVHIAYQIVGDGPIDLVFASEWWFHLDAQWEDPHLSRFLRRLSSFSRLVLFDRRGFGLSDPLPSSRAPTLEETMTDMVTVMDAAHVDRASVLAAGDGTPVSVLTAATHPDRVNALAILNGFARQAFAPDYPQGMSQRTQDAIFREIRERWGVVHPVPFIAPSISDDRDFQEFFARAARQSISRGAALSLTTLNFQMDVRDVLPTLSVPTIVFHREGDRYITAGHGRYLADRIPNSRYVELAGEDHLWWAGETERLLSEVEEFFTGAPTTGEANRVLATVLFTDIVDSTATASAVGDRRWGEILDSHDHYVRRQLDRYGGREIQTTGDGFLALFDAPGRAVRCAEAIVAGGRSLGLGLRAGLHTGEVERRGDDVGGIGVHIGQRVSASAGGGQVLVSSTVKDLVVGSGLGFSDQGLHDLKGVPDRWRLFLLEG
jgi:class 3 adenylate cyclase